MDRIQLHNVSKNYGDKQALKNINYAFKPNQITAILGHNGAGKTTLVQAILDLIDYDGRITYGFDKRDLYDKVSCQLQFNQFERYAKLKDIVRLYLDIRGSQEDLSQLLDRFDLQKYRDSYVNQLSGGERQRLNIALALIGQPRVLILDEMTTSLDVLARKNIWQIIKQLKQAGDITIIVTSHFMDEVEYLADQILILDHGQIHLRGSLEEIKHQVFPHHTKYRYINDEGGIESMIVDNRKPDEFSRRFSPEALKQDFISLEDVFLEVLNYRLSDQGDIDHV